MYILNFLNRSMTKIIFLFSILFLTGTSIFASLTDELGTLNYRAKVKYVTPEALDQVLIDLKAVQMNPGADSLNDFLVMDTYRAIASGYSANFHFKQAYEAFRKYVVYKENILVIQKEAAINNTLSSVTVRELLDEREMKDRIFKLSKLESEKQQLEADVYRWKRNISISLLVLSSIFALMLVSSGIKLFSRNSNISQNKETIKRIHRKSTIGSMEPGLSNSIQKTFDTVRENTKELKSEHANYQAEFPYSDKEKQVLANIEKNLKEA